VKAVDEELGCRGIMAAPSPSRTLHLFDSECANGVIATVVYRGRAFGYGGTNCYVSYVMSRSLISPAKMMFNPLLGRYVIRYEKLVILICIVSCLPRCDKKECPRSISQYHTVQ
jgi:hypothetical protein